MGITPSAQGCARVGRSPMFRARSFAFQVSSIRCLIVVLIVAIGQQLAWQPQALSAEPSRFTAAQFKSAELKFVEGLPVAIVGGTPEEIGHQLGVLLKQPLS